MTTPYGLFVVGGGLLGSAVAHQAAQQGIATYIARGIPWADEHQAVPKILSELDTFLETTVPLPPDEYGEDQDHHPRWAIAWCAGAGVTGTSQRALNAECELFSLFINELFITYRHRLEALTFFYASSAGGVYAGSVAPPFTEDTLPSPIAPYGFAKLRCEEATTVLTDAGATVAIGRISNLYGPGQNIDKPQGLVSHLCLAHHKGTHNKIFVSLDTLRDYLYVDDAAILVLRFLNACSNIAPGQKTTKILAHGQSLSVAEIVGTAKTVLKRAPQFVHSTTHQTALQARDLRLKSLVFPEIDRFMKRTFPSGFMMTNHDIGYRYRLGLSHCP